MSCQPVLSALPWQRMWGIPSKGPVGRGSKGAGVPWRLICAVPPKPGGGGREDTSAGVGDGFGSFHLKEPVEM